MMINLILIPMAPGIAPEFGSLETDQNQRRNTKPSLEILICKKEILI